MKSVQSEMKPGLPVALGGGAGRFDPEIVSCRALVIDATVDEGLRLRARADRRTGEVMQAG